MQQIAQDIQNHTFKKCYLLYGEEAYLVRQYRDRLRKAIIPEDDTMNYNYYAGKEVNVEAIIDQAETMPFFAEKRLIMIENSGLCKKGGDKLADYIKEIAPDTIIIMVEDEVDKRSKLFKAFSSAGNVTDFTKQPFDTLAKWILTRVKHENKTIDKRAVELLLDRAGTDMSTIAIELEKIFSYTYEKDAVTAEDVLAIVTVSTSAKVFDMTKAMAEKRQKQALDMYHDLLAHKESPFGILTLIARQFNMMLQTKDLYEEGYSVNQIADKLGLWSKYITEYKKQADSFSKKRLQSAIEACVQADEDIKLGRMLPEMAVELLIIEYSAKQ